MLLFRIMDPDGDFLAVMPVGGSALDDLEGFEMYGWSAGEGTGYRFSPRRSPSQGVVCNCNIVDAKMSAS